MKNNVNNKQYKTIQNFSSIMKKTVPISILTAENTIFIKTNQNKLTSNYLRNGNQIKQSKQFLSTKINQSQKLNNSLKNTFSLGKSNLITKLDKKNLNDINNKINEILKHKKIQNNHLGGTNSFIKIDRRNKKNNLSSINTINELDNENHIFNFYKITKRLNNSSFKGKYKMQNKLIKNNDIKNRNGFENENEKNSFNSTYIGIKNSRLKQNNKTKNPSLSKKNDINLNKTMFFKKINYSNNLSNFIKSSNQDNIYFRTLNSYMDKEKDYFNGIKKQFYYSRKLNNKYIYSFEKKKEKSLAEKRQRAKKPISYLIKNNYLSLKNNPQNINRISTTLNNEKNEKPIKRKNTIKYKEKIYNIDNYNSTINVENEEKNKNRNLLDMKSIESNNDNYIKTLPNFENRNKLIKINKDILTKKNQNENNNIVNNNYYNINNTFIFDTDVNKLAQYNLTKLITKNDQSLNYNFINNYNSNNFKTIDTEIEKTNRNNIIKKLNKAHKIQTKPDYKNKTKNKNLNDYKVDLNNKNNNNKLNINKITNLTLSNLINGKIGQNYFQFLSNDNKMHMANILKKGIIKGNNSNINKISENKNSKDTEKIQLKNINQNNNEKVTYINNKHKNIKIKNSLDLYNKLKKKLNHNIIYKPIINRKKSENVSQISKYTKTNNIFNNTLNPSLNNRESSSINNKKILLKKEKKDIKVLKIDTNNNIRKNKIISYKILNNKNKNKSYNIEKLSNNCFESSKNNYTEFNNIISKENELFFSKYDNNENISNNDENYSINTYEVNEDEIDEKYYIHNNKKQYSSFELISFEENNLIENTNQNKEENEDNFDDINSIIKKIDFNENENMNIDIFSLNNNKYREFTKKFNFQFDELFNK